MSASRRDTLSRATILVGGVVLFVAGFVLNTARGFLDPGHFADRLAASLGDDGVAVYVADRLTDAVVEEKPDLIPVRPLILATITGVVRADSFRDEWAEGGSAVCLACHDESSEVPILSIFATAHGVKADERTPMGSAHECQSCHGASAAHIADPGSAAVPVAFGEGAPVEPQNEACLACHRGGMQINWSGSAHDVNHVRCATCHTIHAKVDRTRETDIRPNVIFKQNQTAVCFGCHQEQRALAYRAYSHPVMEGKMSCTSCHNPHGSMAEHMLAQPTLNETCYRCHAEKRGPFLWEHAPARENCGYCHTPHGSNHPSMLAQRQPLLCQQCHISAFHPSTAYAGPDPNATPPRLDIHLVAKGCLNCHSEVHGSNHPSGPRFTR